MKLIPPTTWFGWIGVDARSAFTVNGYSFEGAGFFLPNMQPVERNSSSLCSDALGSSLADELCYIEIYTTACCCVLKDMSGFKDISVPIREV